jgi:hypothetical protein
MRKTFVDSSPASKLNFEIHSLEEEEATIASPIVYNILQKVEIKQKKEQKQVHFQEGENYCLPKISSTMTLKLRTICFQEGENDEIMHLFATLGVYIEMSPWPPHLMMMRRQGYVATLKITLSRGRLKCKKGRMTKTCLLWIQTHPHVAIWVHLLNTVNSFLYSSTKYFKKWLLPNNLIIVRNHGDDEEDKQDIKRVLERKGDAHINSESRTTSGSN